VPIEEEEEEEEEEEDVTGKLHFLPFDADHPIVLQLTDKRLQASVGHRDAVIFNKVCYMFRPHFCHLQ
jgi:hypothetical protein